MFFYIKNDILLTAITAITEPILISLKRDIYIFKLIKIGSVM